jgi:hypothetical protein
LTVKRFIAAFSHFDSSLICAHGVAPNLAAEGCDQQIAAPATYTNTTNQKGIAMNIKKP